MPLTLAFLTNKLQEYSDKKNFELMFEHAQYAADLCKVFTALGVAHFHLNESKVDKLLQNAAHAESMVVKFRELNKQYIEISDAKFAEICSIESPTAGQSLPGPAF
jgi:hypothetical protein